MRSPTRAIFLDRDNTLIQDAGYTHKVEDFVFMPKCIEAMHLLDGTDYKKIIITNQAGIAKKYYTEDDYAIFTNFMLDQFRKNGILIDAVYHCPHMPSDGCFCRKPNNELLQRAAKEYNIRLEDSWMIGDKAIDVAAGFQSNTRTVKLGDPMPEPHILFATHTASNIYDAMKYIVAVDKILV